MRGVNWSAAVTLVLFGLILESCASAPARRGHELTFTATAYCDRGITKSGTRTRDGIIAADPARLPLGSVIRITAAGDKRYHRQYTVMDTGRLVRGSRIDLYVRDCEEAREFGVRKVRLEVIRIGR